jgi:hypothetical protein
MFLIHSNLAAVTKVVNEENARFGGTAGIRVSELEGGSYRVEATNGRVLARVDGVCPGSADDYPSIPAIEAAPNSAKAAILPVKAFCEAQAAAKKIKAHARPILKSVAVQLSDKESAMGSTNLESASVVGPILNLEGRWPSTDEVFPKGSPTMTVRINAKMLAELLGIAAGFSEDKDHAPVTLSFYDANGMKPIRLDAKDAGNGQTFSGLIVPLSKD